MKPLSLKSYLDFPNTQNNSLHAHHFGFKGDKFGHMGGTLKPDSPRPRRSNIVQVLTIMAIHALGPDALLGMRDSD